MPSWWSICGALSDQSNSCLWWKPPEVAVLWYLQTSTTWTQVGSFNPVEQYESSWDNKVTRPPPVATKFNKLESKVASWTTCSQMQGSFLATVDGNHRMAASFLGTLNWYLHLFTNFIKASTVDLCFSASTNNTYVELIRNIKNDKHRREINKKDVFL